MIIIETKDHAELARFLAGHSEKVITAWERKAFAAGCVEPDYNPFTYLRGSIRHRALRGHNAENVKELICRKLGRLQQRERFSLLDWFALGTAMHYIADSFTLPHNRSFKGSVKEHIRYERKIHEAFRPALRQYSRKAELAAYENDIPQLFCSRHARYSGETPAIERDCAYIITVCLDIFQKIVWQEEECGSFWRNQYESAYNHGLV